jgi:hypothetical protein
MNQKYQKKQFFVTFVKSTFPSLKIVDLLKARITSRFDFISSRSTTILTYKIMIKHCFGIS